MSELLYYCNRCRGCYENSKEKLILGEGSGKVSGNLKVWVGF